MKVLQFYKENYWKNQFEFSPCQCAFHLKKLSFSMKHLPKRSETWDKESDEIEREQSRSPSKWTRIKWTITDRLVSVSRQTSLLYMTCDTIEIIVVVVTKDAILSKSRLHYYEQKIFDGRKTKIRYSWIHPWVMTHEWTFPGIQRISCFRKI